MIQESDVEYSIRVTPQRVPSVSLRMPKIDQQQIEQAGVQAACEWQSQQVFKLDAD